MQNIRDVSTQTLYAEYHRNKKWIDGPKNDGRLTAASSAQLDLCFDEIEAIEKELVRRGMWVDDAVEVHPELYPFMLGLDWRSHYKSLWLGWWLVTWRVERWRWHFRIRELSVEFQPGL